MQHYKQNIKQETMNVIDQTSKVASKATKVVSKTAGQGLNQVTKVAKVGLQVGKQVGRCYFSGAKNHFGHAFSITERFFAHFVWPNKLILLISI